MLARKLKILRSNRAVSLMQLEEATGINMTTLSNYENGSRIPGRNNLTKLATYYKVSTDYLLDLTADTDNVLPPDIAVMFKSADWKRLTPEEQDTVRRVIRAAILKHSDGED